MSVEPIIFTPLNFDISFLAKNVFVLGFIREFSVFLLNFSAYSFILLKLLNFICLLNLLLLFDIYLILIIYLWI